ncbi:MAG TPA: hypothetical protein VNW46_17715, partial [Gemmatimonadaceae bacterium]|nr:hypothetical protein [Gemmatimonadaceae bacterium]
MRQQLQAAGAAVVGVTVVLMSGSLYLTGRAHAAADVRRDLLAASHGASGALSSAVVDSLADGAHKAVPYVLVHNALREFWPTALADSA